MAAMIVSASGELEIEIAHRGVLDFKFQISISESSAAVRALDEEGDRKAPKRRNAEDMMVPAFDFLTF